MSLIQGVTRLTTTVEASLVTTYALAVSNCYNSTVMWCSLRYNMSRNS